MFFRQKQEVPVVEPEPEPEPEPTPQIEDEVPQQEEEPLEEPQGDYLDVHSRPFIMKMLRKQGHQRILQIRKWAVVNIFEILRAGDGEVLFADKVLKFTASGKMKRRFLIITDSAVYIIDPQTDGLKRRIALGTMDRMCLSELSDNFFSIIIPTEYDLLMASTRKTEIATSLYEAIKARAQYELELTFSNRFEYNATASLIKEVLFEEIEGAVRTRIVMKNY